ncbi:MAG: hypothetical protein ACLPLP_15060 [Mycobacterium sp.]
MRDAGEPFIGSEALACGASNRHRLRTRYRVDIVRRVRDALATRHSGVH